MVSASFISWSKASASASISALVGASSSRVASDTLSAHKRLTRDTREAATYREISDTRMRKARDSQERSQKDHHACSLSNIGSWWRGDLWGLELALDAGTCRTACGAQAPNAPRTSLGSTRPRERLEGEGSGASSGTTACQLRYSRGTYGLTLALVRRRGGGEERHPEQRDRQRRRRQTLLLLA